MLSNVKEKKSPRGLSIKGIKVISRVAKLGGLVVALLRLTENSIVYLPSQP